MKKKSIDQKILDQLKMRERTLGQLVQDVKAAEKNPAIERLLDAGKIVMEERVVHVITTPVSYTHLTLPTKA